MAGTSCLCWANGLIAAHSETLCRRAGREAAGEEGRNGRGEAGGDKDRGEGGGKMRIKLSCIK